MSVLEKYRDMVATEFETRVETADTSLRVPHRRTEIRAPDDQNNLISSSARTGPVPSIRAALQDQIPGFTVDGQILPQLLHHARTRQGRKSAGRELPARALDAPLLRCRAIKGDEGSLSRVVLRHRDEGTHRSPPLTRRGASCRSAVPRVLEFAERRTGRGLREANLLSHWTEPELLPVPRRQSRADR